MSRVAVVGSMGNRKRKPRKEEKEEKLNGVRCPGPLGDTYGRQKKEGKKISREREGVCVAEEIQRKI